MPTKDKSLRVALTVAVVTHTIGPSPASAGEILGRLRRLVGETKYHGTPPKTGHDCSMELLAENIDWLEHHIDTYGSIVAKQPDIWGEARLTKHRDEYERTLFGQLNQFRTTVNAAIRQSDSSFLSQAIALSIAAGGAAATPAPVETSVANQMVAAPGSAAGQTQAPPANAQLRSAPDFASTLQFGFEGQRGADGTTQPGISLEPTVMLDQMSRYLNHLHELRRINEGDDTSDSPGYALNLVRIPVSVLPGKLTRRGFGAEITITAEPVISDDLMPTTFRNLAINDVVDLLGLPLVRTAEAPESERLPATLATRLFEDEIITLSDAFDQNVQAADVQRVAMAEGALGRLFDNDIIQLTIATLLTNLVAAERPTGSANAEAKVENTEVRVANTRKGASIAIAQYFRTAAGRC